MSKELVPLSISKYTDNLCEYVPIDYCHDKKCDDFCPFYRSPGVVVTMIYRIKDVEDENE